jgi:hypothetical protein
MKLKRGLMMTTQEINRYIKVAIDWERKYCFARLGLDNAENINYRHRTYIYTLESQLKIQDNAIKRMELENIKIRNHRRYLACALLGFVIGQIIRVFI